MDDLANKWEGNKWYLLATLYGVARRNSREDIHKRNRLFWNRYFSSRLSDQQKNWLLSTGRSSTEELRALSEQELEEATAAFQSRQGEKRVFHHLPSPSQLEFFDLSMNNKDDPFYAAGYVFPVEVDFTDSAASNLDFSHCTFFDEVWFDRVTLDWFPRFENAYFGRHFHFWNSEVNSVLNFDDTRFNSFVDFYSNKFSAISFRRTRFERNANFTNSEFRGPTDFDDAEFLRDPPEFYGVKMHEGTTWLGTKWPEPNSLDWSVKKHVSAYERLKLEMDKLKRHEDELHFFAMELKARAALAAYDCHKIYIPNDLVGRPKIRLILKTRKFVIFCGRVSIKFPEINWSVARIVLPHSGTVIKLYGLFSDYGRSYRRPLLFLCALVLICWPFFYLHLGSNHGWDALGLSAANTFGIFGFRKDLIVGTVLDHLSGKLKILSALQTIAGGVLVFLVGLALRNRLRMK